jgi:hypothetical protein
MGLATALRNHIENCQGQHRCSLPPVGGSALPGFHLWLSRRHLTMMPPSGWPLILCNVPRRPEHASLGRCCA